MSKSTPLRIPATYMRGGTSKGLFFRQEDLPAACQVSGAARDRFLQRVLGSPDPYGKQIDGMGGATSSTSKCAIVGRSSRPGHDVDYLYAQVAVQDDVVDWSGNCGNLSTAAGAFAIRAGFIDAARLQGSGTCTVRIWQANTARTILAHVPVQDGQVREAGDFLLDGVAFPSAEIVLEFLDPADGDGGEGGGSALLPTGQAQDVLEVPGVGRFAATFIQSGIPTIFLNAQELGLTGRELQGAINGDAAQLARLETIRAHGALRMGLVQRVEQAATRQHTPKLAFVAPAQDCVTSSGRQVAAHEVDLLVRALSMGQLHHAMMGTAAVAIATAAAIPGTLVSQAAGGARQRVRFGHPSGTLAVGAEVAQDEAGRWRVTRAVMGRSARVLMEGWVYVPVP